MTIRKAQAVVRKALRERLALFPTLLGWNIQIIFSDADPDPDKTGYYTHAYVDPVWQYQNAVLVFHNRAIRELEPEDIQEMVTHELSHCVLAILEPDGGWNADNEDWVATTFARAVESALNGTIK